MEGEKEKRKGKEKKERREKGEGEGRKKEERGRRGWERGYREEKKMEKRKGKLRRRERGRCEEERSLHFLGGWQGVAQGTHHLYICCIFRWFSAHGASSLFLRHRCGCPPTEKVSPLQFMCL